MKKRLAIFAGYDSKNRIDDYVIYYLKELNKVADIVFVYDNEFPGVELDKVRDLTIHQICERHGEYDFGSYKRGYLWARENGLLDDYDSLILCNDSVFGPFYPLEPIFEKFEARENVDFWGMFCHHGVRTKLHIQSYFVVLKKQVFTHFACDDFLSSVSQEARKIDIVRKYELGFSQELVTNGFKADALCTSADNQPNDRKAMKLLKQGFPFLKKGFFNPNSFIICHNLSQYKTILKKTDYNIDLIDNHINSYIGKEKVDKYLSKVAFMCYLFPIKRFFFQKKIDWNSNLIIKICKLQVLKKKIKFPILRPDVFVSVVMPVYNGAEFVAETIESILGQTHSNFEFIIIDDCSTDNSYEILKRYAAKDERIRLFRTPENFGNPGGTTAYGLEQVSDQSQYIVMTDQDDISVKERLAVQIDFMERKCMVDICGGRMKLFGTKSRITRPPEKDDAIKARLLTSVPMANPTLIIRKLFLVQQGLVYRNQTSQDYLFLAEAALMHKAFFHNIRSVLVYYRCHEQQTSTTKKQAIKETSDQVREYQLKKLGLSQEEIEYFNIWKHNRTDSSLKHLQRLERLFKKILILNAEKKFYPDKMLSKRLNYLYKKELLKSRSFSGTVRCVLKKNKSV